MKRFLSISIILVSFAFSSYNVNDQISISDQQLTKEVCYAAPGSDFTIGDDFNLFIVITLDPKHTSAFSNLTEYLLCLGT